MHIEGAASALGQEEEDDQSLSHKPLRNPGAEIKLSGGTRGFWAMLLGMEDEESESEEASSESQCSSNSHGLE